MINTKNRTKIIIGLVAVLLLTAAYFSQDETGIEERNISEAQALKLYWFIPDGFRADPELFDIYQWAEEGMMPNLKKLMDSGSYGFAYPNFPSHTPTNFATLLTGAYPSVHGVNDGPMREIGKSLDKVAVPGFRSTAKKVPPIWKTLEDEGYKVSILSVPGSTPPEVNEGEVYRGRWGGWGSDIFPLNFETGGDLSQRIKQGRAAKLFFFGAQLTQYVDGQEPSGWGVLPKSYSDPKEIELNGWGTAVYGYIYDSTDDRKVNYDKVSFSLDKKKIFGELKQGDWSEWQPITLKWKQEDVAISYESNVKVAVIKLDDDGFFRIRLEYDTLNENVVYPSSVSDLLKTLVGPMVDFADNYPPQLVYYPEDKKIFMDEADMSFDWHQKAVSAIKTIGQPNVVIHDIYTPNQMLTSRWWMGYIDPTSSRYNDVSESERAILWEEVRDMYKNVDDIIGEILKIADSDTYIVLSSDHGAIPLDRRVALNNLFAQKGWLKFEIDPQTGEPIIDWENTKVIYLKMAHVYVNPDGLAGNYERASGPEYTALRNEVKNAIAGLQDADGKKPLTQIVEWENAESLLKLDPDRTGDLVVANAPGFGWNEEMSKDLVIFTSPIETGYKQAIKAEDVPGMWAPFVIAGPGVKSNNFLGNKPFSLIDEYPTVMKALKMELPDFVEGKAMPVFR